MKLSAEQMEIIEKADKLTGCYSSTIEETHWLNEEEAFSLIESFVETTTRWQDPTIEMLYNKYMGVKLELFDMYELLNKIREILGEKENDNNRK